jgi:hypothetical protein
LERFPVRYLTGYFVAVKAIKKKTENIIKSKKKEDNLKRFVGF